MTYNTNIASAAAVRLTTRYPFWVEIYYSLDVKEATPEQVEAGIKTLATDGRSLWICAAHFKPLPLESQVMELVHELGHKIYLHPSRMGFREPLLWNIACDFVINAMMKTHGFNIPSDWLLDMKYDGWLAESVYADLLKKRKEDPSGKGQPQLGEGRADLKPMEGASPEEVAKHEANVQALVERAIANAKAMGKLPAGIEAGIVEAYQPPKEPWYNALHRYMQSLSASTYNWARINRRTLKSHGCFTPLHYSESLGDIAVAIDASGSVFDKASQSNFCGHLNAILAEARPHRVHIYYFDSRCYPGEIIEAGELDITTRPKGGGGTAFEPVFHRIEADGIEPAVLIIMTDLMGSFPSQEPDYPVLWVSIEDSLTAPFGETLYVD